MGFPILLISLVQDTAPLEKGEELGEVAWTRKMANTTTVELSLVPSLYFHSDFCSGNWNGNRDWVRGYVELCVLPMLLNIRYFLIVSPFLWI